MGNTRTKVFITIDTECSMGNIGTLQAPIFNPVGPEKRIYGKINEKEYGIPFICNELKTNNLKGIFFVEVMSNYYFGEDNLKNTCDYIKNGGHDVQLHIHPCFKMLKDIPKNSKDIIPKNVLSDSLASYSLKEQIELIKEGKELLYKWLGEFPIAFRAGGFRANLDTINALKTLDFLIDSNYNYFYLNKYCFIITKDKFNCAKKINSIIEFPVTNLIEFKLLNSIKYKPLDINAVCFEEIKRVLEDACQRGLKEIVLIMHSFSFIKKTDVLYSKMKPDIITIKRFKRLCSYLNANSDRFETLTFEDYVKRGYHKDIDSSNDFFPYVGNIIPVFRKVIQGINRFYFFN